MMWRYLGGALAALMLMGAGMLVFGGRATADAVLPAAPVAGQTAQAGEPLPATMPEATPRTREQKRFGRYDKDRDGGITRDEYMASRRKAYARLDVNGDGRLSFDEWSVKTIAKFTAADRDKSGAMSAPEFVTTAVKRKVPAVVKCPPVSAEES